MGYILHVTQELIDIGYLSERNGWKGAALLGSTCPIAQSIHDKTDLGYDYIHVHDESIRINATEYDVSKGVADWIQNFDKFHGKTNSGEVESTIKPEPISLYVNDKLCKVSLRRRTRKED